jgi:hypothetical protein
LTEIKKKTLQPKFYRRTIPIDKVLSKYGRGGNNASPLKGNNIEIENARLELTDLELRSERGLVEDALKSPGVYNSSDKVTNAEDQTP